MPNGVTSGAAVLQEYTFFVWGDRAQHNLRAPLLWDRSGSGVGGRGHYRHLVELPNFGVFLNTPKHEPGIRIVLRSSLLPGLKPFLLKGYALTWSYVAVYTTSADVDLLSILDTCPPAWDTTSVSTDRARTEC